ncbi:MULTISPECIES: heparinase II/III family protein [Clostridium]|jgi:hypothetical protein|uniref:heparinase II/III domain-containing protein n=1 Tax=Clostridium TaxID=1485 RepID=UPI00115819F9|nr:MULTISPECIES: heparinase II/III family protein [Clostridium]MDU2460612.1 heparinase II/III family protein [Clostridium sp.]MDU7363211.1 heparinase II/III family protein [Clostridium sp.]
MKLKNIDKNNIIRLTPLDDTSIEIAKKIIMNKFYLSSGLEEIDFNEEIDWEYSHVNNKNTYLLYLHSLTTISYLVNAYELTKFKDYLEKAKEVLYSWMKYEKSYTKNDMIWYDHTVASRSQNILYFYGIAKDELELDTESIESMIMKHVEFLYDDNNYSNNNHGIMMDKALIVFSKTIESDDVDKWSVKAISRLKETFYNSFTLQGVHLENSIYYHNFVYKLYIKIEEFLNEYELTLGKEILERFNKINNYFKYAAKPNGELPLLGDTTKFYIRGVTKDYTSFFDKDAGIVILQSKDEKEIENSTWLSFICGNFKKTHKHYDDLSFTLYYKGEDIFVDSGSFGYGRGKERYYMQSAASHNTLMANKKNYKMLMGDELHSKVKLNNFLSNKYYDIVKGQNYSYEGIGLERTIVFFKPDIIIVFDKAISENENVYSQIFNLSPQIKISKISNEECELKGKKVKVNIRQILPVANHEVHLANRDLPKAVISEKTGKLIDTAQVEFYENAINKKFITLITLDSSENRIKNIRYDENCEVLKIKVDDLEHTLVF